MKSAFPPRTVGPRRHPATCGSSPCRRKRWSSPSKPASAPPLTPVSTSLNTESRSPSGSSMKGAPLDSRQYRSRATIPARYASIESDSRFAQHAIDVLEGAGLERTRTEIVGRDQPIDHRAQDLGLAGREVDQGRARGLTRRVDGAATCRSGLGGSLERSFQRTWNQGSCACCSGRAKQFSARDQGGVGWVTGPAPRRVVGGRASPPRTDHRDPWDPPFAGDGIKCVEPELESPPRAREPTPCSRCSARVLSRQRSHARGFRTPSDPRSVAGESVRAPTGPTRFPLRPATSARASAIPKSEMTGLPS